MNASQKIMKCKLSQIYNTLAYINLTGPKKSPNISVRIVCFVAFKTQVASETEITKE
jgi:hypothetical protein